MTTISSSYVHHRIPPFPGFYAHPMPSLDIRTVGDGPKQVRPIKGQWLSRML